jgi:hypothetical protein
VLALYDEDDRTVSTMVLPIVVQLAMAEARIGEFATAAELVDGFLAELGQRGGPATRGTLHETRARIALAARDSVGARLHLTQMEQWFRPTENPALVARCEQLRRELDAGGVEKKATSSEPVDTGLSPTEEVRRAMRGCTTREQRFERALELLLERTSGRSGQLFSYADGRLVAEASRGQTTPEAVRDRLLQHFVKLEGDSELEATATESGVTELDSGVAPLGEHSEEHRFFVLMARDGSERRPVAAAVIAAGRRQLHPPLASLLSTLAEELLERDPVTVSVSR